MIGNKEDFKPLSANPTKSSKTLKQFAGILPTNCLSVFDHFFILALKGLKLYDYALTKEYLTTATEGIRSGSVVERYNAILGQTISKP